MASILYNIIISPIEFIVEFIFEVMWRLVGQHETNQGLAVIGVSVAISLLTLPLYRRADAVQQKERDIQKKLLYWVSHIKKNFKGDERFMMLQTYYRENGYNPIYALNGSVSLLLEIPFFIAAYHFLSHLEVLKGASFGIISDLGLPDGLVSFGTHSINVLPILMTAINCISSAIYLKGFPLKDKIQTYGMALIFLVLLYNSPAGLVVYWTCNNIFSLVKNVFYKIKNPKKVFVFLCAFIGLILTFVAFKSGQLNSRKKYLFIFAFLILTLIPLFVYFIKERVNFKFAMTEKSNCISLFVLSGLVLTLLCGFVVPLNIVSSSPGEFILNGKNPLLLIYVSFAKALGLFLAWPLCLRLLFKNEKEIYILDFAFVFIMVVALLNVFLFPTKAGLISIFLKYEKEELLSWSSIGFYKLFLNGISILLLFIALLFLFKRKKFFIAKILGVVFSLSLLVLGFYNVSIVQKSFTTYKDTISKSSGNTDIEPIYHFSKTGKNVFVIMLDRAGGAYLPYIFNEKPELYNDYDGFVYYPNTVSFSLYTLAGAPPLYGGYEYVPVLQNQDLGKTLLQKREEAISLLPRIFSKNGYSATMTNMPWIGETKTSDFYFMDNYPEKITSLFTNHKYREAWISMQNNLHAVNNTDGVLNRTFICNAIVQIMPYFMRKYIYDDGIYFRVQTRKKIESRNFEGDAWNLLNDYSELDCLPESCDTTSDTDTFVFMQNPMPHHPRFLQFPNYTIEQNVTFDESNPLAHSAHYHVNAASIILLGKWLRWLKENDVYDNTRIIISADHGSLSVKTEAKLKECQVLPNGGEQPLLLVKDFAARGKLKTDDTFMTNADVPTLAVKNLIDRPINPVSGNDITKISLKHPAVITYANWLETKDKYGDVDFPNNFSLNDDSWWMIQDSIFDSSNWKKLNTNQAIEETKKQLKEN